MKMTKTVFEKHAVLQNAYDLSNRYLAHGVLMGWAILCLQWASMNGFLPTQSIFNSIQNGLLNLKTVSSNQQEDVLQSAPVESVKSTSSSVFAKRVVEINRKWQSAVTVEAGAKKRVEVITINGLQALLTDKNRPRVNREFSESLHPLMSDVKSLSKKVNMTVFAGASVPVGYVSPILRYFQNFYGWKGDVQKTDQSNSLEIRIEVQK